LLRRQRGSEHLIECYQEPRQAVANGVPDDLVIDRRVSVDQNLVKRDDLWQIRQLRGDGRVDPTQSDKRFANDFELAFDCGSKHVVVQVIVVAPARGEASDALCCAPRVPQKASGFGSIS
jgi:hypothetical protein